MLPPKATYNFFLDPNHKMSLKFPLQDKIAIVTGASRGLGTGMALELAKRGAKVTAHNNHYHHHTF